MIKPVKTRIAPSPTGYPHVGTAYIALFNFLYAKIHKGTFLLRIEDTDSKRNKIGSMEQIMSILKWLGLNWDEGPEKPNNNVEYIQSHRYYIYKSYYEQLLNTGCAYRCFCSEEQLTKDKKSGCRGYSRYCRDMDPSDVKSRLAIGDPYTIRLKVPYVGGVTCKDLMRGEVYFNYTELDDQILVKSDGVPTYHLASVIDDHLMDITHVIRGEEWLSSVGKHILLYNMFGWTVPQFLHMPILLTMDGKKLAKRDNTASIEFYRSIGVLPGALLNFLFLLGISSTTYEKEIMGLEDMMHAYSIDKLCSGAARFDVNKLLWINQQHLSALTREQFLCQINRWKLNEEFLGQLFDISKGRVHTFSELFVLGGHLFVEKVQCNGIDQIISQIGDAALYIIEVFDYIVFNYGISKAQLLPLSKQLAIELGVNHKSHMMPLLFTAISGNAKGLPLFESMQLLGIELVLVRLRFVRDYIIKHYGHTTNTNKLLKLINIY